MNTSVLPTLPRTLMYSTAAAAALAALPATESATIQAALETAAASDRLAAAPGRREFALAAAGRRVLCQPHGERLMVLLLAGAADDAPAIADPHAPVLADLTIAAPGPTECERLDAFHAADDGFRVPEPVLLRRLAGQSLVRAWREQRGLPLPRLASATGLDAALVQRLERPGQRANARQAQRIGEVLGVPVDALRF